MIEHFAVQQYIDDCLIDWLIDWLIELSFSWYRVQANETLGNLEPAFKDIKILIQREPKNTAIQETYRRWACNSYWAH